MTTKDINVNYKDIQLDVTIPDASADVNVPTIAVDIPQTGSDIPDSAGTYIADVSVYTPPVLEVSIPNVAATIDTLVLNVNINTAISKPLLDDLWLSPREKVSFAESLAVSASLPKADTANIFEVFLGTLGRDLNDDVNIFEVLTYDIGQAQALLDTVSSFELFNYNLSYNLSDVSTINEIKESTVSHPKAQDASVHETFSLNLGKPVIEYLNISEELLFANNSGFADTATTNEQLAVNLSKVLSELVSADDSYFDSGGGFSPTLNDTLDLSETFVAVTSFARAHNEDAQVLENLALSVVRPIDDTGNVTESTEINIAPSHIEVVNVSETLAYGLLQTITELGNISETFTTLSTFIREHTDTSNALESIDFLFSSPLTDTGNALESAVLENLYVDRTYGGDDYVGVYMSI